MNGKGFEASGDAPVRSIDALIAIALQVQARLDARDGVRRNLGNEAILLRKFGYKNSEVAAIIGSTAGSVAELISRTQKNAKGAMKRKRKDARPKERIVLEPSGEARGEE